MTATPRRYRRFLQLSLRTLFVLLTLAAIWLGVVFKRVRDQRAAVARIDELGGRAFYDFEFDNRGLRRPDAVPPGSPWLRRLFGPELFQSVVQVRLDDTAVTDADLRVIGKLRGVTGMHLNSTNVSDAGLRELRSCKRIHYLGLMGSQVTSDGLRYLQVMDELDTLILEGTVVDDIGVRSLLDLKRLQILNLGKTRISARGVALLVETKTLRYLLLRETPVDESAVSALSSMNHLAELHISGTRITGQGLQAIRQALPGCEVDCDVIDLSGQTQFENPVTNTWWANVVLRVKALDLERRVKLIDLSQSNVEDNHTLALHSLKHVDFIDLRGTRVTEEGAQALRRTLLHCEVVR